MIFSFIGLTPYYSVAAKVRALFSNSVLLCTLDLWRHDRVPRGGILLNPNISKCKGGRKEKISKL